MSARLRATAVENMRGKLAGFVQRVNGFVALAKAQFLGNQIPSNIIANMLNQHSDATGWPW